MPFLHCHRFYEIERVFAPGVGPVDRISGRGMSQDLIRGILFGITTILSRCSICGKYEKTEVYGDARKPGKENTP